MRYLVIICLLFTQHMKAQMSVVDQAIVDITSVIRHDVFTAPAASRIYAYTTIAGNIGMSGNSDLPTPLRSKLTLSDKISPSDTLAALAMYVCAQRFIYSDSMLLEKCKKRLGSEIITSQYFMEAQTINASMADWINADNYTNAIASTRYTPLKGPLNWVPTPPDYAQGTDPHWGEIMPFCYKYDKSILPVPAFVLDSTVIAKEAQKLYVLTMSLDSEQMEIALFWDDNPFILRQNGHLQYAEKKVSPPGHWLDITRMAILETGADAPSAMNAYMLVSIAMADAMIAVWDIKYETQLIRPETYINTYIDSEWRPYLQTPPFPEFPSGHSAVSAAAATILTSLFGDNFAFTDATETTFGLPARGFKSFEDAASEASQSRVYGGIHFVPAVTYGAELGKNSAFELINITNRR